MKKKLAFALLAISFISLRSYSSDPEELKKHLERFTSPEDAQSLLRFLTVCGAKYKGKSIPVAVSATSKEGGFEELNVEPLRQRLTDIKKSCDSFGKSGNFYICRKGAQFKYYDDNFNKLSSQPCDQILKLGDKVNCLKLSSYNGVSLLTSVESHTAGKAGEPATCTESPIYSAPADDKKRGGPPPAPKR